MGRARACFGAAVIAAIWIGCGSSSSTDNPADAGADAASDHVSGDDSTPGACPATKPQMGDSCVGQISCSYNCEECACNGATWQCTAPGCSGVKPCPVALPSEGDSCATGGGCCAGVQESPCMFAVDAGAATATCTGSVWHVTTSPTDAGPD